MNSGLDKNFWSGRRVLVTGHTGFKGSWLSLWLSELNALVTGVSLEPSTSPALFSQLELSKKIFSHNIFDIRDRLKLNNVVRECNPEVVFHLAAQPLVRKSYEEPLFT